MTICDSYNSSLRPMKPAIIVWGVTRTHTDSGDEEGSCVNCDQAILTSDLHISWSSYSSLDYTIQSSRHQPIVEPSSDINKITRYFYHELVKDSRRQRKSTRHHEAQILWNSHLPVGKDLRRTFHSHHSLRTTPSNDIIIKLVFIGSCLCVSPS